MPSQIFIRSLAILALVLSTGAAGCKSAGADKAEATTGQQAGADKPGEAAGAEAAPAAGAATDGKKFTLATKAPEALKSGASGDALVTVTPGKGWKWNKEYPASLSFAGEPSQVTLAKTSYKQLSGDFNATEKQADIKVAVTGKAAGKETLKGELKFSVCDATTCVIEKADVAINLEVAP